MCFVVVALLFVMCSWILMCLLFMVHVLGVAPPEANALADGEVRLDGGALQLPPPVGTAVLVRRYLSKATCLIRPHLFHALFTVSRITIICQIILHCAAGLGCGQMGSTLMGPLQK